MSFAWCPALRGKVASGVDEGSAALKSPPFVLRQVWWFFLLLKLAHQLMFLPSHRGDVPLGEEKLATFYLKISVAAPCQYHPFQVTHHQNPSAEETTLFILALGFVACQDLISHDANRESRDFNKVLQLLLRQPMSNETKQQGLCQPNMTLRRKKSRGKGLFNFDGLPRFLQWYFAPPKV